MNKENKKKLPVKQYVLYFFIAAVLITSVTLSKYVTSTSAGDAARTAHMGELDVYETEDNNKVRGQHFMVIPGVGLRKDPVVDFKNSEMSAYIFVIVNADGWSYDTDNKEFYMAKAGGEKMLKWQIHDSNWNEFSYDSTTGIGIFCYRITAGAGDLRMSIIQDDSIWVSSNIRASELEAYGEMISSTLTFKAYAVQSTGFENAQEAWASVSQY